MDKHETEQLLSRQETAKFLGVTEGTLAVWACTKRYDLKYVKVGRLVKYRYSDIERFLEQRTQNSNSPSIGK